MDTFYRQYMQAQNPLAALDGMRSEATGGHPIRRLLALLRCERRDLWVVVIYSVGVGLLSLAVPLAAQALVNTIAFGSLIQPLVALTLLALLALAFASTLNALRVWTVELIQQRLFVRVASDVTHRLLRARIEAFDRLHGPELVNRFFDVVTVQKAGALLLMDGLSLVMQTLVGLVLLAVYHPFLLAFDLILLAAMAFIVFVLGRRSIKTAIVESKAKYKVAAWLEEVAEHPPAFRNAAGSQYALEVSDRLTSSYVESRREHFRIVLRQVIGSLALQALASAALLGIGGFLVIERQLTLGQLVAAELIVTAVVGGFSKFGKKFETYYDLLAAIDKLGQLIDLPLEREGGFEAGWKDEGARIDLRDVAFRHEGAPGAALSGASAVIEAGERVGLIGPGGAGKSTLLELIAGLREQQQGVVLFNGVDTRELSLDSLRDRVLMVQQASVFTGTVLENVTAGRSISIDEVRRALVEAELLDEILALPRGLQTPLMAGGKPLTASQEARLMLARAFAGRPAVLLLDDALLRIDDADLRRRLAERLFDPDAPWTLICVTENPELLSRCDRVLALEGGRVRDLSGGGVAMAYSEPEVSR